MKVLMLRTPVKIKYPAMRAPKRRASKARGWRIPLSIRPPGMAVDAAAAECIVYFDRGLSSVAVLARRRARARKS